MSMTAMVSPAPLTTTSTKREDLGGMRPGTLVSGPGGGLFVVVKAAAAIGAAQVAQSPAAAATHQNLAVAADTAVGARTVRVTTGAVVIAENAYEGGKAIVSSGPGLGQAYTILGHNASNGSTVTWLDLALGSDTVRVAMTSAASKVDLQANPYMNVILAPAAASGAAVGVAVAPIANGEYAFLQVAGLGVAIIDGTPAIGMGLVASTAVPGSLAIASSTLGVIATSLVTGVAGRAQAVMLKVRA